MSDTVHKIGKTSHNFSTHRTSLNLDLNKNLLPCNIKVCRLVRRKLYYIRKTVIRNEEVFYWCRHKQAHRQFSCYAGLAPFQYTSGSSVHSKRKVSQRANKKIKSLLHRSTISSIRYDGEMRTYYLRKLKEGKNAMLILNAIRGKIVARIFAIIKRNEPFVKVYHNPSFTNNIE